jgi:hypothetical protein
MATKQFFLPLAAMLGCAAAAMAQVAPTTVFQLDGNAANDNLTCSYGQPCDYWNLLNGNGVGNPPGQAGNSLVRTFINGKASTDSFTGGGSKDSNLISQWAYSASPTPNKDTLNAGYAAAYESGGDFELIFGADRASPSGDANIGIWFFQNNVAPNGSGGFTGAHMDHDIFVISAFTGGGGTSTISVYEWDHTCASGVKNPTAGQCADTNLRLLAAPAAVCGSSAYCAITNGATTNTTWEGGLASPLFFEGGIDLTAALRSVGVNQLPCFTSFLEETRSSQSTTAVLKDFLAGGFPVCGLSITKACGSPSVVQGGTEINYPVNGIVTNTGVGTLYNVSVFDTPAGGATRPAIVVSNNSGSANNGTSTLGPGETGTWNDATVSAAAEADDSAIALGGLSSSVIPNGDSTQSNTVTTRTPATAQCTYVASTSLSVTKNCKTNLQVQNGVVDVLVGFSGTVYNNGPSQVTGIVLTDTPTSGAASTINVATLGPCGGTFDANGNCTTAGASANYSSSYVPTNIDMVVSGVGGPGTGPGRYFWSDAVTISGAKATVGTLNKLTSGPFSGTYGGASASCPICQGSGECTP